MRIMRGIVCFVGVVLLWALPLRAFGQSVDVNVSGLSGPWEFQFGGLNSTYTYGFDDETAPTTITNIDGKPVEPAQELTVTYLSGLVSVGPTSGWPYVNALGDTAVVANSHNTDYPSWYMPTADEPIYIGELVGTFANSSGEIVGTPFPVGLSAAFIVPAGASQLQLGTNDDIFSDNAGSWDVQVSEVAVPEPTGIVLIAFAFSAVLLHRRYRTHRQ